MRKSSQAVSLVLIGSTLLYFGCDNRQSCNKVGPDGKPSTKCSGSSSVHGVHGVPGGHGGGTATQAPGKTGTTTGGFGAHGATSSGAAA